MKSKKEKKADKVENEQNFSQISSKDDLRQFLLSIRDGLGEEQVAPIYAMSAMNFILNLPDIYTLMDNANKELGRDIWLRLKQAGMQIRNPVLLFGAEDGAAAAR